MRRAHLCGFVGALKHSGTRMDMARGMKAGGLIDSTETYKRMGFDGGFKCAVYFSTSSWSDKNQMKVRPRSRGRFCWCPTHNLSHACRPRQPYEYRQLLQNSQFAPVPLGRGPDSFRLYEALESGAIPIITDIDNFNIPLGKDHPLPKYERGLGHGVYLVSTFSHPCSRACVPWSPRDWSAGLPKIVGSRTLFRYYADTTKTEQRRTHCNRRWWPGGSSGSTVSVPSLRRTLRGCFEQQWLPFTTTSQRHGADAFHDLGFVASFHQLTQQYQPVNLPPQLGSCACTVITRSPLYARRRQAVIPAFDCFGMSLCREESEGWCIL